MGRIFEAHDQRLDRRVAIKELIASNAALRERFRREIAITARLQHPSIVPVYDAGVRANGEPYYVMKLLRDGRTLNVVAEAADLNGRIALLPNVIAVADAVAYAHSVGIIHRDLKPSNVLGAVVGTPQFMAPEQARGEPRSATSSRRGIGCSPARERRRPLSGCVTSVQVYNDPDGPRRTLSASPLPRLRAPLHRLIVLATLCGMAKFVLPSTMALSLKFITDRLVGPPPARPPTARSSDVIARGFEAYLGWATALMPPAWRTPWGAFNILIVTLLVIYALWAVALYYRSYLANLAGHRTILDLRTDLYQHLTRLSHSFFQEHQSGAHRVAADGGHRAGAELRRQRDDQHLDGSGHLRLLHLRAVRDGRAPGGGGDAGAFPSTSLAMRGFGARTTKTSREVQEATEIFSGDVQERVAGIHVVKSFRAEKREVRTFFAARAGCSI